MLGNQADVVYYRVKQEVLTRLAAMLFPVNTTSDDKQMELSSGASSMDRDYSTSGMFFVFIYC